jgi:8-oxo-dGTP diphosphatase
MKKIAAIILENKKGEILLYLRDNKPDLPFPNQWDLFGGHVENGETIEEALIREGKEELNYDLKEYKFFRKYYCPSTDPSPNTKYIFYSRIDKNLNELELSEGQKLCFFKREEIYNIKIASILKRIVLDWIKEKAQLSTKAN